MFHIQRIMDYKAFLTGAFLVHSVTGALLRNVARLKSAQASSRWNGTSSPAWANDGNYASHYRLGSSCFATALEVSPWWMVDLQAIFDITGFMVLNRIDCCPGRLKDFTTETFLENPVDVPTTVASHCYFYSGYPTPGVPEKQDCDNMVVGRFFRLRTSPQGSDKIFSVCEVEVYTPSVSTCTRFIARMNARIPTSNSLVVKSPVECAEECKKLVTCLGFNFKQAGVSECEIVTIIPGPSNVSQGWKFYQYEQC